MATKTWDELQQWGVSVAGSDLLPKLEGGDVDWVAIGSVGLVGVLALVAGALLYARRDTEFVRNFFPPSPCHSDILLGFRAAPTPTSRHHRQPPTNTVPSKPQCDRRVLGTVECPYCSSKDDLCLGKG